MLNRLTNLILVLVIASGMTACTSLQEFLAPLRAEAPVAEPPTPLEERPRLEPIARNQFVLESPGQTVIGDPQVVFATEENTFSLLAREYGLGYDELVAANPDVDPWLPGEGTPVLLPTQYVLPDVPHEGIVLNIATKRLFYFPAPLEGEPQVVLTYPIGIGRVGWETPLGHSAVVSKATDPHWWVPASVRKEHEELGDPLPAVVPPGPDNPLGRHVLKLDLPGYLIHGTNQPYGVGMRVSHGCVRLYPENIEVLYGLVGLGESVTIVNEPYLAGLRDGEIYIESHAPLEDDLVSADEHLAGIVEYIETATAGPITQQQLDGLRSVADHPLGVPVRLGSPSREALFAAARVVTNTVTPDPNMPTLADVRAILDAPPETVETVTEEDAGQVAADE